MQSKLQHRVASTKRPHIRYVASAAQLSYTASTVQSPSRVAALGWFELAAHLKASMRWYSYKMLQYCH